MPWKREIAPVALCPTTRLHEKHRRVQVRIVPLEDPLGLGLGLLVRVAVLPVVDGGVRGRQEQETGVAQSPGEFGGVPGGVDVAQAGRLGARRPADVRRRVHQDRAPPAAELTGERAGRRRVGQIADRRPQQVHHRLGRAGEPGVAAGRRAEHADDLGTGRAGGEPGEELAADGASGARDENAVRIRRARRVLRALRAFCVQRIAAHRIAARRIAIHRIVGSGRRC